MAKRGGNRPPERVTEPSEREVALLTRLGERIPEGCARLVVELPRAVVADLVAEAVECRSPLSAVIGRRLEARTD